MPFRLSDAFPIAPLVLFLAACASGSARTPRGATPAAECMVAGAGGSGDSEGTSGRGAAGRVGVRGEAAGGAAAGVVKQSGLLAAATMDSAAVTVALTASVDPAHAPWPRNPAERLLFAQLYEPLLRVDCTGAMIPGLAQSWSSDGSSERGSDASSDASSDGSKERGRDGESLSGVASWTFVLRSDASFADGTRVHAADVVASWESSAAAHAHTPAGPVISAIASGARPIDDSTLIVTLPDSVASLRSFASPLLAVARPVAGGSDWPLGTTSYYVDSTPRAFTADTSARALVPGASTIRLRSRSGAASLLFRVEPGADPRDVLDGGADLLATADASAVQYARTQANRESIALPWTRSYLLLIPGRHGGTVVDDCPSAESNVLRMLRDALTLSVHAEARGASGPCWWEPGSGGGEARGGATARATGSPAGSATELPPGSTPVSPHEILYLAGDPTARELAERIAALVAPGRMGPAAGAIHAVAPELFEARDWSVAAADSSQFAARLALASEGAYIVALPRDPDWPAAARAMLAAAAPWLASLPSTHSIIPLVDTRETLLIRRQRGIPRMTISYDGTVVIDAAPIATERKEP
jgi:hypothetical protein